ncbi:MAG: hypothetical protein MR051_06655 [Lentisphaeria bacterium]|nr:hypothetical protein [Lentisphaeria bacterium]
MNSARFRRRRFFLPLILLMLIVGAAAALPPAPVWITDSGNKYLILCNLAEYGEGVFRHPVPELFPYCGFHFQLMPDGGIRSFFPETLAAATLPFRNLFGDAAASVLSISAAVLIVFFTLKLSRDRLFPVLALVCASPLVFYAVQMWEMLPAAALVTAAAWCFYRGEPLGAGLLFGCGVWMREELYVLGAAFGLALLIRRRGRELPLFALGAAIPVLILWTVNLRTYGHIFGLHGGAYFTNNRPDSAAWPDRLREIGFNYGQQLLRFDTVGRFAPWLTAGSAVVTFIAGCAPDFRSFRKFRIAVQTISVLAGAVLLRGLFRSDDPLLTSARTAGLLFAFPAAIPVLAHWRALLRAGNSEIRLTALTVFLYLLLFPLFLNANDIGLTWSSRHCIVVMPLLALLCGYALGITGACRRPWLPAVLLSLGCAMQIWAMCALYEVSHRTRALENTLREAPEKIIVSDVFFLPEMTPRAMRNKLWLEITDLPRTEILLRYLKANKIDRFLLVLSPRYRRLPNPALAELLRHYRPAAEPERFDITPHIGVFLAKCEKTP